MDTLTLTRSVSNCNAPQQCSIDEIIPIVESLKFQEEDYISDEFPDSVRFDNENDILLTSKNVIRAQKRQSTLENNLQPNQEGDECTQKNIQLKIQLESEESSFMQLSRSFSPRFSPSITPRSRFGIQKMNLDNMSNSSYLKSPMNSMKNSPNSNMLKSLQPQQNHPNYLHQHLNSHINLNNIFLNFSDQFQNVNKTINTSSNNSRGSVYFSPKNNISVDAGIEFQMGGGMQSQIKNDSKSYEPKQIQIIKNQNQMLESQIHKNQKYLEHLKSLNRLTHLDLKQKEVQEMAIAVLQKNSKNQHEEKFLLKCIEGLPLFKKHEGLFAKATTTHLLSSSVSHVHFQKFQTIFNFGEFGHHYYIVLRGNVQCLIPHNEFREGLIQKQKQIEQQEHIQKRIQKTVRQLESSSIELSSIKTLKSESVEWRSKKQNPIQISLDLFKQKSQTQKVINSGGEILKRSKTKDLFGIKFPEFFVVKVYSPGESFGEIALMTKERRTATMVCREDTDMMILSKEGYQKMLGAFEEQIMQDKVDFLKQFEFLTNLPTSSLMSLVHYFKIQQYPPKTILYSNGDQVTDVYFIRTGEVEIQKLFNSHDEQKKQQDQAQNANQQVSQLPLKQRFTKMTTKMNAIKLLGGNQCFGEEEVVAGLQLRNSRVVATQQSEIYSITKEHILATLRSQKGLQILEKQLQQRAAWNEERETFIAEKSFKNRFMSTTVSVDPTTKLKAIEIITSPLKPKLKRTSIFGSSCLQPLNAVCASPLLKKERCEQQNKEEQLLLKTQSLPFKLKDSSFSPLKKYQEQSAQLTNSPLKRDKNSSPNSTAENTEFTPFRDSFNIERSCIKNPINYIDEVLGNYSSLSSQCVKIEDKTSQFDLSKTTTKIIISNQISPVSSQISPTLFSSRNFIVNDQIQRCTRSVISSKLSQRNLKECIISKSLLSATVKKNNKTNDCNNIINTPCSLPTSRISSPCFSTRKISKSRMEESDKNRQRQSENVEDVKQISYDIQESITSLKINSSQHTSWQNILDRNNNEDQVVAPISEQMSRYQLQNKKNKTITLQEIDKGLRKTFHLERLVPKDRKKILQFHLNTHKSGEVDKKQIKESFKEEQNKKKQKSNVIESNEYHQQQYEQSNAEIQQVRDDIKKCLSERQYYQTNRSIDDKFGTTTQYSYNNSYNNRLSNQYSQNNTPPTHHQHQYLTQDKHNIRIKNLSSQKQKINARFQIAKLFSQNVFSQNCFTFSQLHNNQQEKEKKIELSGSNTFRSPKNSSGNR